MLQQDQQLINNLIEQQQTSAYQQQINLEVDSENQLAVTRVVTAKYKVYVIILLIVGVILGTRFLPAAWASFQATQQNLESKQQAATDLDTKITMLTEEKKAWKLTEKTQKQIIACFNEQSGCDKLPANIQSNLPAAIAYLQLGNLNSDKMGIDEKKILKNLDQYLIRNNPSDAISSKNGDIQSISIGEEKLINPESKFYELPISIKVTFSNKDDLISFVDNIEKYIILAPEDRILYKIQGVSYDMAAYEEEQETEIELQAYYFR